jgi:hypothetical protein
MCLIRLLCLNQQILIILFCESELLYFNLYLLVQIYGSQQRFTKSKFVERSEHLIKDGVVFVLIISLKELSLSITYQGWNRFFSTHATKFRSHAPSLEASLVISDNTRYKKDIIATRDKWQCYRPDGKLRGDNRAREKSPPRDENAKLRSNLLWFWSNKHLTWTEIQFYNTKQTRYPTNARPH